MGRLRGTYDKRCAEIQRVYGCTIDEFAAVDLKTRRAYHNARRMASDRKIEWRFTLPSWIEFWKASGHWENRGLSGFVMCRRNDGDVYSPETVYIGTQAQNVKDTWRKRQPTGVQKKNGKFVAKYCCDGKQVYIGRFETFEDASVAYRRACAIRDGVSP